MIKEVNQACKKLNDTLGISVELPNPKKKSLKTAAVLGGISVISSAVLRKESS